MFRKSCGKCHFTNTRRPSDITIADFWGWEKTNPDANKDDKGLSLIICNTEKGRKLFESVKEDLNYFPAELENVIQPNMQQPSEIHPQRDQFEKDYSSKGFKYVLYKYGDISMRYKCRQFIRKVRTKLGKIKRKFFIF